MNKLKLPHPIPLSACSKNRINLCQVKLPTINFTSHIISSFSALEIHNENLFSKFQNLLVIVANKMKKNAMTSQHRIYEVRNFPLATFTEIRGS